MTSLSFNSPQGEHVATPGISTTPTATAPFQLGQASHIIGQLGKQLGMEDTQSIAIREIDISRIQNAADVKEALEQLLQKTDRLLQENGLIDQLDSNEAAHLNQEIHALENRILQMRAENAFSKSEADNLEIVTNQLHTVIEALPAWIQFQSLYFKVDDHLEETSNIISSSVISSLHGCSPAAVQSMQEITRALQEVIELSKDELNQPNHPFAPEVWKQLFSSINTACWNMDDECHALLSRSTSIIQQALEFWDQMDPKDLGEVHVAASLLLSQQQLMEKLNHSLEEMENRVQTCLTQLPPITPGIDPADYRRMQAKLAQLAETLSALKAQIPNQRHALDEAVSNRQVSAIVQEIHTTAGPAINMQVKEVISAYSPSPEDTLEEAIDRYIPVKRALMGFESVSKEARKFCRQEEVRLTERAGYSTDFEGLAYAKVLQEREKPPGMLTRAWEYLNPGTYSPKTIERWGIAFSVLQLASHVTGLYQQISGSISPVDRRSVSKEEAQTVSKETAMLGLLMSPEKYGSLEKAFEKLTGRSPEIRETLKAVMSHYPHASFKSIPEDVRSQIMDNYTAYRHNQLLGREVQDPHQWVSGLEPIRTDVHRAVVMQISDTAEAVLTTPLTSVEQLQQADKILESSQQVIRQCSRLEYLQPKSGTTPQALHELKNEVALMRQSLRETMAGQPPKSPAEPWADWNAAVANQCYTVKSLEERVNTAMQGYEEALALGTFQQEEEEALSTLGNKHLNLIKQANLQAALELDGIEIPVPHGVESHQVHRFLQTVVPEVFTHWEELGKLYAAYEGQELFVKTDEAARHLEIISSAIEKAFAAAGNDIQAFQALGLSGDVKSWLEGLAQEGHYLMVRSTGAEDSKKSANAGGNISVAYVEPTLSEFCKALGEVVGSYFGAGSLQNRLNAEQNPFEEELKLAVTAQKLIGEPIGGATKIEDIPISLVLFTNEPLFYNGEEFRVMRISATFGHGEGVVGNQGIGSDTALILQSVAHPDQLYYQYDNQSKPIRLAPQRDPETEKVFLQKLDNPEELAEARALTPELLQRLYEWGIIGEKFFGDYPTDMEIVIRKNTIYPVQARPVNRPSSLPTYIDPKKIAEALQSPLTSTIKLRMIVPGKASVVELSNPQELETAETLEKAEKQFDKKVHKLVIVGQSEPANSHPVVNFSSMGIPCLWSPEMGKAREMAAQMSEKYGVAFCVQSSRMFLWDKSQGSVSDYTSQGYIVHPAQISESLPVKGTIPVDTRVLQELPEEVHEILFRLQTAVSRQDALQELKMLQASPAVQTFRAKLAELEAIVAKEPLQAKVLASTIAAARALDARLTQAFEEVEALLTQPQASGKMELLLHAKILEALLFQTPETSTGIAQYSVASLTSTFAAADALIAYQSQLSQPAKLADMLMDGSQSPIEGFFEEWQTLLLELEKAEVSKEEIIQFKSVIQTLRSSGTLPFFATFLFNDLKKDSAVETLRQINNLITETEKPIISQLLSHNAALKQLRTDISLFGESKSAPEAWNRLQTAIEPFLPPQNTWMEKAQWDQTSAITRSIATEVMNELVDVYDLSIKAMKASPEISDVKKTQEFKKMLGPYLQLLRSWAEGTVGEDGFVIHQDWSLESYLNRIEEILSNLSDTDPTQLRASRDFSVLAAVLGAGTAFQRHYPERLEDVFTLIHQGLLATTSTLLLGTLTKEQMETAHLPENLKSSLKQGISLIGGEGVGVPKLIGIEVNSDQLKFSYNTPLRNHSSKFSLNYNSQTQKLEMQAQFLGEARQRWGQALERAALFNNAGIIPFSAPPTLTPQEVTLSWDISEEESMQNAMQQFQEVAVMSLANRFSSQATAAFIQKIEGKLRQAILPLFGTPLRDVGLTLINKLTSETFTNPLDPLNNDIGYLKTLMLVEIEVTSYLLNLFKTKLLDEDIEYRLDRVNPLYRQAFQSVVESQSLEKMIELCALAWKNGVGRSQEIQNLFLGLIKQNKYIDQIFDLAATALLTIADPNDAIEIAKADTLRSDALRIFQALIAQDKGTEQTIHIAQRAINNSNRDIKFYAAHIFGALAAQGKGIEQAILAAQTIINDSNLDTRIALDEAIEIFKTLIAQDKGIEQAILAAQTLLEDNDKTIKYKSVEIFKALIEQGKGIEQAILTAQRIINNGNLNTSIALNEAIEIFKALIEQDKGIEQAILAAQTLLEDSDKTIKYKSVEIFKALIAQDKGIEQALLAAQEAISNNNWDTSVEIFKALIAQGKGIEQAILVAQEAFADDNVSAFPIFEALIVQDKGIEQAILAAQTALSSRNENFRYKALGLFGNLIAKGKSIEQALLAAEETMSGDNDRKTKRIALQILENSLKTGYGIDNTQILLQKIYSNESLHLEMLSIMQEYPEKKFKS